MSLNVMTWVFRQTLPPREKVAALAIADEADDTGECFTRNSKLAAKASLSVGTFKRAKKQLLEWGLLEQSAQIMVSGRQSTNLLKLRIDRDVPFDVAEWVIAEGSKSDPSQDDESESEADAVTSESQPDGGVQSAPPSNVEKSAPGGSQIEPHGGVTAKHPTGESTGESPISLSKAPTLKPVEVVPNFGSIKSPALPSRKPQGSAETENVDRDSQAFIAEQFERLKTIYQQFNKAAFIGNEQLPWKTFRKWPFEKRNESLLKLPLYFKGFNASFARWNSAKPSDRGEKPKCASLRDYICGVLFENIGYPTEPILPPKPVSTAWIEELKRMPLTPFDLGEKVFVELGTDAWRDWVAAFKRANLLLSYRKIGNNVGDPNAGKTGHYFRQALPPREEEFTEQSNEGRAA